jgi:hypothetical protein
MQDNKWVRLLAYVTGSVNQRLLLQNEYLAAENQILRSQLPARLRLSDPERPHSLKSARGSAVGPLRADTAGRGGRACLERHFA